MRQLHFISGLPRSGSTLLSNILAQNEKFHVTSTSGILNILVMIRNQWDNFEEFKASPDDAAKKRVLKGVLDAYHNEDKIIFDKSRGWLAYLEMAEMILGRKAKVLVPVRDLRDVIASFEKIWRENTKLRPLSQEVANLADWQTLDGRCKIWANSAQPVGIAYNRIKDALQRGFKDRMHFVRFEDLTSKPERTMKKVYAFLEEDYFEHDFENVEQVTQENDLLAYGIPNLHTIRNKVEAMEPQWPAVLGNAATDFANQELW